MSQILLVCLKENIDKDNDEIFDAIFTEESDIRVLLDWVNYYQGVYYGPLRITFRDAEVFPPFNYAFNDLCKLIKISGFEDVCFICHKDKKIEYPKFDEVVALLGIF